MPTSSEHRARLRQLAGGLVLLTGASWTLFALANFPAVMTPDSLDQWGQMLSGSYTNWHPVAHTLFLKLASFNGGSPALAVAAQMLLMLGAVAGTLLLAIQLGAATMPVVAAGLYFAVLPIHGAMVVCLWKDIPFAAVFVGFTLGLVFLSAMTTQPFRPRHWWWLFGTGIGLGMLRHNGLLCTVAGLAGLMAAQPARRRPLALCLAAILATLAGWKAVVQYGFKAASSPVTEMLAQPLQQTAALVAADRAAITPAQREKLSAVLPWPAWVAHQNQYNVDDLKFNPALNAAPLTADPLGYFRLWLELARAQPGTAMRAALHQNAVIWDPAFPARDLYPTGIAPNRFGLQTSPPLPGLASWMAQLYVRAVQAPWAWLVRPAVGNIILLGAAALALGRAGWRGVVPFAPWIASTAVMAVMLPSPDFRYFYPAFAALPVLLLHVRGLRPAAPAGALT